jgi:hypothetical protein
VALLIHDLSCHQTKNYRIKHKDPKYQHKDGKTMQSTKYNINKTQIKENQKTMNKNSAENQTEKNIYQGADRVPLDVRGDYGSAAS